MAGRPALPPAPTETRIQVPHLITDPVWALKPWPVTVEVGGQEFTIPAMPAADWLSVLMVPEFDPDDVLPGLLPDEERDQFEDLLFEGSFTFEESQVLAMDTVALVSARNWWVSLRLIDVARVAWDNLGMEMASVDAARVPLAAWIDVLYFHIVQLLKKEERTMFFLKLEQPPPGFEKSEVIEEMTADQFLSMA